MHKAGLIIQKNNLPAIDKDHAREFGRMLIQVNSGRIVPVNTLSSEILRKIARKETYKGQTPDQVMLGMLIYPDVWQHEPVIRVSNPKLQEILGMHSGYASFTDFFSPDGNYRLKSYVDEAYRKKPANRRKFENEVIRTDERLNICYLVFTRELLKDISRSRKVLLTHGIHRSPYQEFSLRKIRFLPTIYWIIISKR